MGKPKDEEALYEVFRVSGVDVHVRNDVMAGDRGIRIRYSKLLFKENILVDGIEY